MDEQTISLARDIYVQVISRKLAINSCSRERAVSDTIDCFNFADDFMREARRREAGAVQNK